MEIFFSCFSAGCCFLLSFLLFNHPNGQNLKANKWLSLYMFVMGTSFIQFYLQETEEWTLLKYLEPCISSMQFLLAPFIYTCTLYFVYPSKMMTRRDTMHFVPFIIYSVALILQLLSIDVSGFIALLELLLPFQFAAYLLLSYRNLLRHQKNLKIVASSTKGIGLEWLRGFLNVMVVLTFFWIYNLFFPTYLVSLLPFLYTVSIFICGYYAIRQKAIFRDNDEELKEITALLSEKPGSKAGRIPDGESAILYEKLLLLMETDKLYTDSELTISKVAALLGATIHEASYVINTLAGTNFYNFVNQYRVEEVCRFIKAGKTEKLNLLGIAFEAGFNSKTTFNTSFKKITGTTPTQYAARFGKISSAG